MIILQFRGSYSYPVLGVPRFPQCSYRDDSILDTFTIYTVRLSQLPTTEISGDLGSPIQNGMYVIGTTVPVPGTRCRVPTSDATSGESITVASPLLQRTRPYW